MPPLAMGAPPRADSISPIHYDHHHSTAKAHASSRFLISLERLLVTHLVGAIKSSRATQRVKVYVTPRFNHLNSLARVGAR
jgi:hypothetical protein